jgi:hypothetical protein
MREPTSRIPLFVGVCAMTLLAADRAELGMEAYPGFGVGSQTL